MTIADELIPHIERLELDATVREIGANQPLELESSDLAWLVAAGKVEIFVVHKASRRRTHVVTLTAGQMMFGLGGRSTALPFGRSSAPEERDQELLAVGGRGTELVELPLAHLRALARDPQAVPLLTARIDEWVSGLFSEMHRAVPPKNFEVLQAGQEVHFEDAGTVARPRTHLVWVRHVEGSSSWLGIADLSMEPAEYLLPISGQTWLKSREEVRLSCVETEPLLKSGSLWEGLARFHELFLSYVEIQLRQLADNDRQRLARRIDLDQQTLHSAAQRMASVLGEQQLGPAAADEMEDPLLAVCRTVGRAQKIDIRPPPESSRGRDASHRLARICAASRIRHRRLILRDDWWQRDNGPLVGFFPHKKKPQDIGRPVALLPTSPTSYDLVDLTEGTRTPIDKEVSEQLHGIAFMFYPPLPERRVGIRDIVSLALREGRRDLTSIFVVGAAAGLLALLIPLVTAQIFGRIIPGAERTQLLHMTTALFIAAVAGAAFQVTRGIAVLRLGGKMDGTVQAAVWDRLLRLPASFFRQFTIGDLAARSMGIDRIRELLTGTITESLLAALFSIFSFSLLFYYSWRLSLLALGLVLIVTLVTGLLVWLQVRHQREILSIQGKISSQLFGFIHGISKLRVAGAENRAFAHWAERFTEQRERTIQARQLANIQAVFNTVYGIASTMSIFAFVAIQLQKLEPLPLSEFLAFNAAFGQFQGAMLSMIGVFSSLLTLIPLYERVQPILEELPEVDETKVEVGDLAGDIDFSHVSFRYQEDGPLILDDVSFRARRGEFIALVGPSGSGKSTCLRLVLGFEQPDAGSIYFDGMDLPSLDIQSVRRQIGVVLQDGQPMAGDLYSNIVGSSNLPIQAAWQAAAMAGLAEDIKAMPMGMHTIISEGGGTLSGGQKQRLLIARAIVHRPRIILFDEATSSLDNRTQEIVSRSLESLKATRIVVAHRLSTIRHADRIYVIERGRVVEEGAYEELIALDGLFARLAERQTA